LGLDLYDFKKRFYDPSLGRFLSIDPKAGIPSQYRLSPYQFAWNNPILLNDPRGDCPPGVDCSNPLPTMQIRRNRASNLGPGYVRNNGTRFHAGHDLRSTVGTNVGSSLAGTVVSSYNSTSYGNTVVVKSNIHPEAQPGFVGPPRPGGAPEQNVYIQYSHLDTRNVAVGDAVTVGQAVGTVGNTGNASNLTGEDIHLHIHAGTEMNAANLSVTNESAIDMNQFYNNVSFTSADPNANQTNTGVIKTVTNANGQQTRVYQPVNTNGQDAVLLDEVEFRGN
jgi:RHS repeat-associated protein